jgi:hypothetical protein
MESRFPRHVKPFPQRFSTLASIKAVVLSLAAVSMAVLAVQPASAAPEPTTTTLSASLSGSVVTLTATVKAAGVPVSPGIVNFCDAAVKSCTDIHLVASAALTSAGTATIKFRPGTGSHKYKAVFAGTTSGQSLAPSTSATTALTVNVQQPTVTTDCIWCGAVVKATGPVEPTGTVSYLDASDGDKLVGTGTLSSTWAPTFGVSNPSNPKAGGYPAHIVTGDFNGDGIPDLALPDPAADMVTVLLGNGDGTFKAAASPAAGSGANTIVVGDFNGDGFLDMVVMGNPITVLLGDGKGHFTAKAPNSQPSISGPAVVADFNGDGILDVAVIGENGITLLLGNGDGTFSVVPTGFAAGQAIVTGDFNDDGIADLAYATAGSIKILLGNGDGTFTEKTTIAAPVGGADSIVAGDFNGDGNLDLAAVNTATEIKSQESETITVLLGKGDGTFTGGPVSVSGVSFPTSIVEGDFNGDGYLDLVLTYTAGLCCSEGTVTPAFGDGKGNFGIGGAWATTPATDWRFGPTVAADFNGDGIWDMGVINSNSTVMVLLPTWTAEATATVDVTLPVATGTHMVYASYDGDNHNKPSVSKTTGWNSKQGVPAVKFTVSADPSTYGKSITLTAKVTGSGDPPTGGVTFYDGAAMLSAVSLAGGTATYSTSVLSGGVHSLSATYWGDVNYSKQTPAPVSLTVNKATPTVSLTASATSIPAGTTVTFKVKVTGAAGANNPTGKVTLYSGSTILETETLSGSGQVTYSTKSLPHGKQNITATYAGDGNYLKATSAPLSVTAGLAPVVRRSVAVSLPDHKNGSPQ